MKLSTLSLLVALATSCLPDLLCATAELRGLALENSVHNKERQLQTIMTDDGLFRQNFESSDWNFNSLIRVQDYVSNGVPYGRILRVSYPPDNRGSPRIGKKFNLLDKVDSATLSFDFKLHSQFEFVKGGKMHGLAGGTATTGCKPIDTNGWSVRLMWRREGVPEVYVYHQDRENRCGDGFTPENFTFQRGTWYRVDLQVQMNSAPNANDGKALLYVDGQKLVEAGGLRLSGNSAVNVEQFMFSTFYGGSDSSWSPTNTTYIYYDNFTVRRGLTVSAKGQGTECEIFLRGIYNPSTESCCSQSCGSCGGRGCSALPGGASHCCTGAIRQSGTLCDDASAAPCQF